jgi:ABC-2 type transport system ATP-binding protein
MTVIQTNGLVKTYQRPVKEPGFRGSVKGLFHRTFTAAEALKHFDLTVEKGETVGIIGPNGAGKTTLVKLLCGIIQPTAGEVSVLGFKPGELKDDFRRRYAVVMGQKSQLWWDLPALDTFRLNQKIYQIPAERFEQNLQEYTALFGVANLLHAPVRNLSLGERMKMELMAALLHDPELLFLDEPTIGLDAIAQKGIRQFLREINSRRQVTILLTSHYMEDIRHLCRRTLVINEGKKVYDGSLETLLSRYRQHREVQVTLAEPVGMTLHLPHQVETLEQGPFQVRMRVPRTEIRVLLESLLRQCEPDDIRIEEEDIGNVIERIYASGTEVMT